MPLKKKINAIAMPKLSLMDVLLAKYREDPEGFRAYIPDAAKLFDEVLDTRNYVRSPFGLTERERIHRKQELVNLLNSLGKRELNFDGAVAALEHCAVLIEDDNLPSEVDYRILLQLLRIYIGKPLSDITSEFCIPLIKELGQPVVNRISVVRGVILELTVDMKLIAVRILPQQIAERRKAVKFIKVAEKYLNNSTYEYNCREGIE